MSGKDRKSIWNMLNIAKVILQRKDRKCNGRNFCWRLHQMYIRDTIRLAPVPSLSHHSSKLYFQHNVFIHSAYLVYVINISQFFSDIYFISYIYLVYLLISRIYPHFNASLKASKVSRMSERVIRVDPGDVFWQHIGFDSLPAANCSLVKECGRAIFATNGQQYFLKKIWRRTLSVFG